jgi:hypothetical protein
MANSILEMIRVKKSPAEIQKAAEQWFYDHDYHPTKNFSWVTDEDYRTHRFLRDDIGIPMVEKEIIMEKEEITFDAFGKEKKKIKRTKVIAKVPTDEFQQWFKKVRPNEYENSLKEKAKEYSDMSFDSLIASMP